MGSTAGGITAAGTVGEGTTSCPDWLAADICDRFPTSGSRRRQEKTRKHRQDKTLSSGLIEIKVRNQLLTARRSQTIQLSQGSRPPLGRVSGSRVGAREYPRELHLAGLHADGSVSCPPMFQARTGWHSLQTLLTLSSWQHPENPRRQPGPPEAVDLAHPPGQDGPARGPHGPGDILVVRRGRLRHRC